MHFALLTRFTWKTLLHDNNSEDKQPPTTSKFQKLKNPVPKLNFKIKLIIR